MIETTLIEAHRIPALAKAIAETLARIQSNASVASGGYDVLRWFLKGWLVHKDSATQKDLELFAFAHDFEGKIVPEASAKGYLILQAAVAGQLEPNLVASTEGRA